MTAKNVDVKDDKNVTKKEETAPEVDLTGLSEEDIADARKFKLIPPAKAVDEKKDEEKPEDADSKAQTDSLDAGTKEKEEEAKELDEKASDASADETKPKYTPNEKALYRERKKAIERRRQAVAERDYALLQNKVLEHRIKEMEQKIGAVDKQTDPSEQDEDEILTVAKYREMDNEKKQQETLAKEKEVLNTAEINALREIKLSKVREQEIEVEQMHEDYKETTKNAQELIDNIDKYDADNVGLKDQVAQLYEELEKSFVNILDNQGLSKSCPEIMYKIGKLLPNKDEVTKKEVTNEKIDKIKANMNKPVPSAAVSGSGKSETKDVEDITLEEALKLSPIDQMALPPKVLRRLMYSVE